jgi:hypothetical protein
MKLLVKFKASTSRQARQSGQISFQEVISVLSEKESPTIKAGETPAKTEEPRKEDPDTSKHKKSSKPKGLDRAAIKAMLNDKVFENRIKELNTQSKRPR